MPTLAQNRAWGSELTRAASASRPRRHAASQAAGIATGIAGGHHGRPGAKALPSGRTVIAAAPGVAAAAGAVNGAARRAGCGPRVVSMVKRTVAPTGNSTLMATRASPSRDSVMDWLVTCTWAPFAGDNSEWAGCSSVGSSTDWAVTMANGFVTGWLADFDSPAFAAPLAAGSDRAGATLVVGALAASGPGSSPAANSVAGDTGAAAAAPFWFDGRRAGQAVKRRRTPSDACPYASTSQPRSASARCPTAAERPRRRHQRYSSTSRATAATTMIRYPTNWLSVISSSGDQRADQAARG